MSMHSPDLETMTCAELLQEMAHLSSERDHLNAEVATPDQADPEQQGQVVDMVNASTRLDRITHLLKEKGCVTD